MNSVSALVNCAVCNQATHRRCSRCLNIYYCNTEHQRQDWKRHRAECVPKLSKQLKVKVPEESLSDKIKDDSAVTTNCKKSYSSKEFLDARIEQPVLPKHTKTDVHAQSNNSVKTSQVECIIGKQTDSVAAVLKIHTSNTVTSAEKNHVLSNVVYSNKDISSGSAITYEGSSEQEILSESAQQLDAIGFSHSKTVMAAIERYPSEAPTSVRQYPEVSLGSLTATLEDSPIFQMDTSDQYYEICQRLIRDMTQYGVCVLDNFLGKDRGLLVLQEVLALQKLGIFRAGQLVSNPNRTEARNIRSDENTWIDGKEPYCHNIRQLISQVDNIVVRANKMADNGKMGDYNINGRTKAMVACYPGGGSHYVRHVDNPNRDGRCITAIYYLNLNWDVRRCGGLLRVFPAGLGRCADIAPLFDRMLFFWSDRRNPHEVQPAYDTRYAITIWYFDAQEHKEARRRFLEKARPPNAK